MNHGTSSTQTSSSFSPAVDVDLPSRSRHDKQPQPHAAAPPHHPQAHSQLRSTQPAPASRGAYNHKQQPQGRGGGGRGGGRAASASSRPQSSSSSSHSSFPPSSLSSAAPSALSKEVYLHSRHHFVLSRDAAGDSHALSLLSADAPVPWHCVEQVIASVQDDIRLCVRQQHHNHTHRELTTVGPHPSSSCALLATAVGCAGGGGGGGGDVTLLLCCCSPSAWSLPWLPRSPSVARHAHALTGWRGRWRQPLQLLMAVCCVLCAVCAVLLWWCRSRRPRVLLPLHPALPLARQSRVVEVVHTATSRGVQPAHHVRLAPAHPTSGSC